MIKLEVCAASIESVLQAVKGGATRVELCDNLSEGGTTPPLSWIEKLAEQSDIQTFTLIRPRGGDFLYTKDEFLSMKRDIIHCGEARCHGVVIGMLTAEGRVDMERCEELIDSAKSYNMSVTFHRAIDRTANILEAMEDVIELGCNRILTSGGFATAMEGCKILKEMILQAEDRIKIMPGSGITVENIAELVKSLNTDEFHGSFRKTINSAMIYKKTGVDTDENEYTMKTSCAEKIRVAINNANNA